MAETPKTDGAPAPTPDQEVRRLYEEAETRMARAAERVVSRDSFGELLAMVTENTVALVRIGNEAMDLVLRNLRIASRQDINRLTRALGRTEDKLEQVLQEVEGLRDQIETSSNGRGSRAPAGGGGSSGSGTRRRSSRGSSSSCRRSSASPARRSPPSSSPTRSSQSATRRSARPRKTSSGRTARRRCTAPAAPTAATRCRSCSSSR